MSITKRKRDLVESEAAAEPVIRFRNYAPTADALRESMVPATEMPSVKEESKNTKDLATAESTTSSGELVRILPYPSVHQKNVCFRRKGIDFFPGHLGGRLEALEPRL